METIYIIPHGGLCNRMRSIASGVYVAKKTGARAVVYWNRQRRGCNCRFDDLFEAVGVEGVEVVEGGGWLNSIPSRRNLLLPLAVQKIRYPQVLYGVDVNKGDDIFAMLRKDVGEALVVASDAVAELYPVNGLFVPAEPLRKETDACARQFEGRRVIGLHIRGTDHKKSKAVSPLRKFVARVDKELEDDPAAVFFLATDEPAARKTLVERYGSRIIFRDNVIGRDSVAGMRDGLIDLYCLARTSRIVGSFFSSYSDMAAMIGGIELEVCV